MEITTRKYQVDAMQAFADSSVQRRMVVLPTGTGKTFVGIKIAKAMKGPTLWLAHREELITQPIKALRAVWPELFFGRGPGVVKAERNEWNRDFVLASVQTAHRDARLSQLATRKWGLIVVDEAHHAVSASYQKILGALGAFDDNGTPVLGLTATPERADNARLDAVFESIVYQYHLAQAVAEGYLAPPVFAHRGIDVDLDKISNVAGDYNQGALDIAMLEAGIVDEVVAAYLEYGADRKTIAFTVSVRQAEAIAEKLQTLGHAAAAVSGETPTELRRQILADLGTGKLKAVINCMVLTEGFDEPTVDCIIMARPTQSKSLYIQCVGRGLRISPMKRDCLIVDMVGVSKRHNMIQAPVLFGVELGTGDDSEPTVKCDGLPVDTREFWRARLSAQAAGVAAVSRSDLRWLRDPAVEGTFLLNVGSYGTVRMAGAGDEWMLDVVGNREAKVDLMRLTDSPVGAELAQGIAEDYVRRCRGATISKGGKWTDQPASEAQILAIKRWKINPPTGITRGEASDILTAAAAKVHAPATPRQIGYLRSMGMAEFPDGFTKRQAGKMIGEMKAAQQ